MPKVNETKNAVDCLWKAYQFTDELAPYMDFMEDMRSKSSRDINSDSSSDTEEHIATQVLFCCFLHNPLFTGYSLFISWHSPILYLSNLQPFSFAGEVPGPDRQEEEVDLGPDRQG